ncbi:MAG: dTDP-4-amino-4,6-dideoxygalactose transaminase [Myxococcota bacterium]
MTWAIPFNKPYVTGNELDYVARAIAQGNVSVDGTFTEACSRLLEERFGIHRVLLTGSCTSALEIAALLCDLAPGDEVIMPSFTYVATASAFARAGLRPVFVDIRPDTLNLDEDKVAAAITDRTRALVPVHYAGISCEFGPLLALARERGLRIVEDAAQGVNATWSGRHLGAIGDLAGYSFHETKNYACGQGGALCINDPELVERAEVLRDRGTNRKQFFRGEVRGYTWVDSGSSYAQSELLCAYLLAQLEAMDEISAVRARIHGWYREQLLPLEQRGLLRLPVVPEGVEGNHHLFYVLLPDEATRAGLIHFLADRGIQAVAHYMPLHESPMGRKLSPPADLPVTDDVHRRLLRLPLFNDLTEEEVTRVSKTVAEFLERPVVA